MPKKPNKNQPRRVPSSLFRATLAEILEAVGDGRERILVERRGRPPVALISADDLLRFQMLEARRERELQEAEAGEGAGAEAAYRGTHRRVRSGG